MASGGKSAVLTQFGTPEVVQIQSKFIPEPAADEIRVKVAAAGLAFADIKMRHGVYPGAPKTPFTPGYDFSGVVDAVGKNVKEFAVGDHCLGLSFVGSQAEYLTLKTDYVAKVPADLDPVVGASMALNYLTAYQMLERQAKLSPGDTVLIHGGAGGVGTALLDLLKDQGYKIYATASAGKHDIVRSYGATPIDYRTESFVDILQAAGGADAVFDHIGGKHLLMSADAAKAGGRVISYGFLSAVNGDSNVMAQTFKAVTKLKFFSRVKPFFYAILTPGFNQKKYIAQDLEVLAGKIVSGELKPVIGKVLPLEQVAEGHRMLESAEVSGKIVLAVDEELVKDAG